MVIFVKRSKLKADIALTIIFISFQIGTTLNYGDKLHSPLRRMQLLHFKQKSGKFEHSVYFFKQNLNET